MKRIEFDIAYTFFANEFIGPGPLMSLMTLREVLTYYFDERLSCFELKGHDYAGAFVLYCYKKELTFLLLQNKLTSS